MTDRELMQQALEALEVATTPLAKDRQAVLRSQAALRSRLAQPNEFQPDWDAMAVMVAEQQRMAKRIAELEAQPEQEPVALVIDGVLVKSELPEKYTGHLYTAPAQRKPLTVDAIRRIELTVHGYTRQPFDVKAFARAIEAAHGIKENT